MSESPSFEDIKSKISQLKEISKNCEVANASEGFVVVVKQNEILDLQIFTEGKVTANAMKTAINNAFVRLAKVSEKEVQHFISQQNEIVQNALKQNLS
jgi:hypothetical protein